MQRIGTKVRLGRLVGVASAAVLAVGLTACGGSDDSGGGTGDAGAVTIPAELKAEVAKTTERPTSIGLTEPVKSVPKAKRIAYIQCGAPTCAANGKFLKAAADAVGWTIEPIDAGSTPEQVKAAWAQAVRSKPDGVVASGFPRAFFEPELKQLAEAKIPVVDLSVTDPPGNGLSAVFAYNPDYVTAGTRLGNYAVVNSGGEQIKAVMVTTGAYKNLAIVGGSFSDAIKKHCSSCSVDELKVPATAIGKDLPTRISTYLQAHPDINWVYVGFADMLTGVPAALKSASIKPGDVKLVTINNTPISASYMRDEQYLVATHIYGYPEMMWRSIDFLIRELGGESTEGTTAHTLPAWVVTKDELPADVTKEFPTVEDYEAQYRKLWGVG